MDYQLTTKQEIADTLKEVYNEGINEKPMYASFYHSIISLMYKNQKNQK